MRELRLVGPGEDGACLVVEAVDAGQLEGERFTLALDERLRTMTTEPPQDTPQPAPAEARGPAPTPREIQVRVRSGETAEAVAADAGIPLERVMRFALPVLQERVRVTDEARRARARRGGDGHLVPFGELVDSRLARHGVDPGSANWDAFRREDGGWTVTSRFTSHEREVQAKFSFALLNRTVSALDDIAADLLSDRPVAALLPPAPPAPEPVAEVQGGDLPVGAPPRLTAVPNPGPAEPVRPQEAGPAIRPPSRRQKAHTRPVPIDSDDELFDQDAYAQQPWLEQPRSDIGRPGQFWHEPPLPFEPAASSRTAAGPRHRAPRPGEQVRLARSGTRTAEPSHPETEVLDAELDGAPSAPDESAGLLDPAFATTVAPVAEAPATDAPEAVSEPAGEPAAEPADPGQASGKRARRTGEKPRMPSWDDILLGVRNKSD